MEERVEEVLTKVRVKMDRETEEKTRRALTRKILRDKLSLPRLTILGD